MSSSLKFFVSASDFMRCAIPPHGGSRVQQFGWSSAAANLWSVCAHGRRLLYLGDVPNPVNYACAPRPVRSYLAPPPCSSTPVQFSLLRGLAASVYLVLGKAERGTLSFQNNPARRVERQSASGVRGLRKSCTVDSLHPRSTAHAL